MERPLHGWSRIPLAALALALLAALAACGGGDHATTSPPPSPSPTATATAAPTATPEPTPSVMPSPTPAPTPSPTISPTPTPVPCESIECVRENLCRGVECTEADPDPWPCRGYDCIETVPNAFERRIFEPGERIDWDGGVFFLQVATGRTEAYRAEGVGGAFSPGPDGAWVEVRTEGYGRRDWNLLLHRETGQAWRWAHGTHVSVQTFLREEVGLTRWPFAACVEGGACASEPQESECLGRLSPDGRYVAQQWGEPDISKRHRVHPPTLYSSPSVVVADAQTCEPLFRVRSAYTYQGWWEGEWLPDSEGFVLGVQGGYAIARVSEAAIVPLPSGPEGGSHTPFGGPLPAPTGGARYFLYGFTGVYDSQDGDWVLPGFPPRSEGWASWGQTHEEVRYQLAFTEGGIWVTWHLSSPDIQFPPFEEVAFRVRPMEGCLELRAEPNREAAVLECLPHGTRVILVVPPWTEPSYLLSACGSYSCLPATREDWGGDSVLDFVYVRSDDGIEGWVSYGSGWVASDYLEHD